MAISKIVQKSLSDEISLGVKISSVAIANSTYVVKDDTAVNTGGGYIVITGEGFESGAQVMVDNVAACTVSVVSATQIRASVPAKTAGSYSLYVVNTDGSVGIRVYGLTYSQDPTWVSTSPLQESQVDSNISIQLSATGASVYELQSGSSLPSGLSLAANGLLSGTVTGLLSDTTYNFTVEAIDSEAQESPKVFSITITTKDPYWNYTTMLISADGTNGGNNRIFLDSSNNNYTLTTSGNTKQGSFSPFNSSGYSYYFDGAADSLTTPDSSVFALGRNSFCVEAWIYPLSHPSTESVIMCQWGEGGDTGAWWFGYTSSRIIFSLTENNNPANGVDFDTAVGPTLNQWNHIVVTRELVDGGNDKIRIFLNGVLREYDASTTKNIYNYSGVLRIGRQGYNYHGYQSMHGFISELRLTNGSIPSEYSTSSTTTGTTIFTPPVTARTSSANTALLTGSSNRFLDKSSNAHVLTRGNDTKVVPFSPLESTALYSASSHGGSAYFDGTADWITCPHYSTLTPAGDFTIEFWAYPQTTSATEEWYSKGAGMQIYTTSGVWNLAVSSDNSTSYYLNGSFGSIKPYEWQHIVVTRSGNSWYGFVNGVGTNIGTSSTAPNTGTTVLALGSYAVNNTYPALGHMTGVRMINGTAYYGTSNFTPPTTPPTAVANTQLLVNGTNAQIWDWTGRTNFETLGQASVTTTSPKYGTGCLTFDGSGDYLLASTDAMNGDFGTGDFTIEYWAKYGAQGTNYSPQIGTLSNGSSIGKTWRFGTFSNIATLYFAWHNGTTYTDTSFGSSGYFDSTWHHFALVRTNGVLKCFVDGTQVGNDVANTQDFSSGQRVTVGAELITPSYFNGQMDDVRLSKYARYTSNFTAPTSALRNR